MSEQKAAEPTAALAQKAVETIASPNVQKAITDDGKVHFSIDVAKCKRLFQKSWRYGWFAAGIVSMAWYSTINERQQRMERQLNLVPYEETHPYKHALVLMYHIIAGPIPWMRISTMTAFDRCRIYYGSVNRVEGELDLQLKEKYRHELNRCRKISYYHLLVYDYMNLYMQPQQCKKKKRLNS